MVALNNGLRAAATTRVALLPGAAGHLHDIRTPLMLLILANLAAAPHTRRAFTDRLHAATAQRGTRRSL